MNKLNAAFFLLLLSSCAIDTKEEYNQLLKSGWIVTSVKEGYSSSGNKFEEIVAHDSLGNKIYYSDFGKYDFCNLFVKAEYFDQVKLHLDSIDVTYDYEKDDHFNAFYLNQFISPIIKP